MARKQGVFRILESFEEGTGGICTITCEDGFGGDFDFEIKDGEVVFPTEEGGNVTAIMKEVK